jgi:hypothetical protein
VTVTPPQERSSSPRPVKPSPQVWERANEGPCAPLRRSSDEDRDCATSPAPANRCVNCNTALDPVKDANCNICLPCWKSYRQWRRLRPRFTPESAPTPDAEAAAERELLRLCFVHAKDAAWAQWFHECIWLGHDSKVAALAFYRAWEAQGMARP